MNLRSPGIKGRGATNTRRALTTEPGFRNGRGQVVVESTGARSTSRPDQTIYRLRCGACAHEYGASGIDIHGRCCPRCQDGEAGEPLREPQPRLNFGL